MWYIHKPRSHTCNEVVLPGAAERPLRTRTPRPPSQIPSPRFSHCAALYGNHMYVFGGSNSDYSAYNDLYALDLNTRKWRKIQAQGLLPAPREAGTFVAYKGKLLLHGGICRPPYERLHTLHPRFFDDTQIFDVSTEMWSRKNTTDMFPSARAAESASVVGHCVVTFGGVHQSNRLNDCWQFDMNTYLWTISRVRGIRPPERFGKIEI